MSEVLKIEHSDCTSIVVGRQVKVNTNGVVSVFDTHGVKWVSGLALF